MSSVWVCVPSKRPPAEVKLWAEAWRDMGYRVMIQRDESESPGPGLRRGEFHGPQWENVDVIWRPYHGYAEATNHLIKQAIALGATWTLIGGDDVFPDTTKRADEIAQECEAHFEEVSAARCTGHADCKCGGATFGVMQPTGDRWGDKQGPYIERVAGSAWIGREFALRAYGGNGPLYHEYRHMYADEELWHVAQKLGVYWQRPDLCQRHEHWGRPRPGETMGLSERMPKFLKEANSPEHWKKYRAIFEARKAAGFPGHEVKA